MIAKIIDPKVISNGGAGDGPKCAVSFTVALFDIVDMFEEREMRTAESWLLLETRAIDFGGPA